MATENKHTDPAGLLPKIFSGEATPQEEQLVHDWLVKDPSHQKEYDDFAKIWSITADFTKPGAIDVNAEWQKLMTTLSPARKISPRLMSITRIAAAVVLISALAFYGLLQSGKQVKAPQSSTFAATLPDGTRVTLNAGSRISYKKGFGYSHRNLVLDGEAYFEVRKNEGVPFVINAGEACIKVTGTMFNVKAYKKKPEIKVTVSEGSVLLYKIQQPEKQTQLEAGETGTFNKGMGVIEKRTFRNANDIAWKTHIISFQNTPLQEVAEILTNTYHQPIIVDPAILPCVITVHFENQALDTILGVLQSTLDLTISTKGKRRIISGKGC